MTNKRKPDSPLKSEPPPKIRRASSTLCQGTAQDDSSASGPSPQVQASDRAPRSTTPAHLTKANLRRLEEMTSHGSKGPRSNATASSSKTGSSPGDAKSRFSTTDAGFEARFRANGGLTTTQSVHRPPQNEAALQAFLDRSRASASPTPSEWAEWTQEVNDLCNERDVENLLNGAILQDTNNDPALRKIRYKSKPDKQWVNYPNDVGFNNGLSAPKPDRTEGYMRNVMPPNVQALGGSATLLKNDTPFVALPHFAVEVKDWGKSMKQAELQAGYDGAAMVYGRNQALNHVGQPDPPRHASVVTAATDGRKWDLYAHYAHENDATKQHEYIQYPMASGDLLKHGDVKRGRKILRNAQDWARDQSTDLKSRLEQHYDTHGTHGLAQAKSSVPQTPPSSRPPSSAASGASSKRDGPKHVPPKPNSTVSQALSSASRISTSSKRHGERAVSPVRKATASRPPSSSSGAVSGSGVKDRNASSGQNAMPAPAARSSATSSSRRDDGPRAPSADRSSPRPPPSSTRPQAPRSAAGSASSDDRQSSLGRADTARKRDPYRSQYRDRSPVPGSDSAIKPLQMRRSNSPQYQATQPRQQNRDKDRGRDSDRGEARREQGSAGGSSSASTSARGRAVQKTTTRASLS